DYYSHAVFEWITDALGAQGTVCAGGRYDGLVEIQGGKPWPGVGFAMGQERLIELMRASEPVAQRPHLYLVMAGEGAMNEGLQLAERLRDEVPGLRIESNLGGGSFKSQFKRADRSGAPLAIVLGEDELAAGLASVKFLREQRPQEQVPVAQLGAWLERWLSA
ncbi:MAG: His/Gly/Thr/Pro-type tRNA ligase C-terminal domain-containing protein, partial [Lysobacterales bacterium]